MVDVVLAACIGVGLAAACGMRVFLPLLVLGAAARLGWLPLADGFGWVATTPALVGLGLATVVEVGGYYVPWLDHALDTIASPAAVLAGALATASVLVDVDPFVRWALALVAGGGMAAAVQGTTVAARAVTGLTTGGLGNPAVSTVEWLGALTTSLASIVAGPVVVLLALVALVLVLRRLRRRRRAGRVVEDGLG